MSPHQVFAFALFAIVAAVTPGPSNVILASIGVSAGVRRGLPCLFGVVIGTGLMLAVVALGLGSVVLDHATFLRVMRWCGAAVLLWLAWKIATSGKSANGTATAVIGFRRAAVLQLMNPKSWIASVSAAGAYLSAGASPAAQAIELGFVFVLAALPCCFLWLAFGASLQRTLNTERAARTFNVAMGAVLAGSIVLFIR